MNREEFSKRFDDRKSVFIETVSLAAKKLGFSWVNYIDEHVIDDDGCVSLIAKPEVDSTKEGDFHSFQNYISFVISQGFTVEINVEWSPNGVIYHVVSWEGEDEIEWPVNINSSYIYKWFPVQGPECLGLTG